MQLLQPLLLLALGAGAVHAASSWGFEDAQIIVIGKAAVGGGHDIFKDRLSDHVPIAAAVELKPADSLKIVLTATEDRKPARPHQAFLLIRDQDTGLETTFPFSVKESGKAKVELAQKDLPIQLLKSSQPLRATLLFASFGPSQAFSNHVFNLEIKSDANASPPVYELALRYGQREEINHIFRADPKSGPKVISMFFVLAVLATVPVLLGAWAYLGANLSHFGKAIGAAPISHSVFFGSIVSMEGLFFLYYYSWTLFQVLPVAGVISLAIFLSGTKALSEVQSRRLAGER